MGSAASSHQLLLGFRRGKEEVVGRNLDGISAWRRDPTTPATEESNEPQEKQLPDDFFGGRKEASAVLHRPIGVTSGQQWKNTDANERERSALVVIYL